MSGGSVGREKKNSHRRNGGLHVRKREPDKRSATAAVAQAHERKELGVASDMAALPLPGSPLTGVLTAPPAAAAPEAAPADGCADAEASAALLGAGAAGMAKSNRRFVDALAGFG